MEVDVNVPKFEDLIQQVEMIIYHGHSSEQYQILYGEVGIALEGIRKQTKND